MTGVADMKPLLAEIDKAIARQPKFSDMAKLCGALLEADLSAASHGLHGHRAKVKRLMIEIAALAIVGIAMQEKRPAKVKGGDA